MSGLEATTACIGAGQIPKHMSLIAQVNNVGDVANELQNLIDQIRGIVSDAVPIDSAKVQNVVEPNLSDVLLQAPDEIHNQCNRMRDQIQMLKDILF